MAISGRHLQFVQAVIKTACNNCVCSGAPRAPWRLTKYTGVDPAAISGRQLRFRRRFSRYPSVYCEIATAPSGPRNDKSGGVNHFDGGLYGLQVRRRARHASPLQGAIPVTKNCPALSRRAAIFLCAGHQRVLAISMVFVFSFRTRTSPVSVLMWARSACVSL